MSAALATAVSAATSAAGGSSSTSTAEAVSFWLLAPVAVLASFGMLFVRKAVHCALLLALTMIVLAIFYLTQGAPFLGVVQVVVYTGAVMMLFLFVLMLVGVDASDSLVETLRGQRVLGAVFALGFAGLLVGGLGHAHFAVAEGGMATANAQGNVQGIARLMFTRYVFAFEVTSALLITAALGAMVLAHRERHVPRATQRQLSEARFRPGSRVQPSPLPPPGVYARSNAIGTPALLPDGSISELSIPGPLLARGDVKGRDEFEGGIREVEEGAH